MTTTIGSYLETLHRQLQRYDGRASYYPQRPEQDRFGIAYADLRGETAAVGDCEYPFPLHSISKIFTYGVALEDNGRSATLRRVGVEPAGERFDTARCDPQHPRAFNPMLNTGALVAASLVHGASRNEKIARILARIRACAGRPDIDIDPQILDYELDHAEHNRALGWRLASRGMIDGDIEEHLALYLSICSVSLTATDLAAIGATLANGGRNPVTGTQALPPTYMRDVVTVMLMCGMYDSAGQWAQDVGLPAKSGVGGGILALLPDRLGLGLYSPGLDAHGHSLRGLAACRAISRHYRLHMFTGKTTTMPRPLPTRQIDRQLPGNPASRRQADLLTNRQKHRAPTTSSVGGDEVVSSMG